MATSHVDLVPTLLDFAGIDRAEVAAALAGDFSEVHPLPGRSLADIVDGACPTDPGRTVYLMTRDTIIEGDDGLSAAGRAFGDPALTVDLFPAVPLNVEGVVARVDGVLWEAGAVFR